MTGQVIAVAVATAAVVSALVAVLGYRLQARQVARQARESARQLRAAEAARAQTAYLAGMSLLASGGAAERLVGAVELRALAVDPSAGEYAGLARAAVEHLLPVLDSLPPGIDGPREPGPH